MRVTHSEYAEFAGRFDFSKQKSPYQQVAVEIETASGDLAQTIYLTEQIADRAADWLCANRTAHEVNDFERSIRAPINTPGKLGGTIGLEELQVTLPSAGPAANDTQAWTFESHRRDCPHCGRRIMKAATRCGYCWVSLEPQRESLEELRIDVGPVGGRTATDLSSLPRRPCGKCGRMIMLDAARCGYCWTPAA